MDGSSQPLLPANGANAERNSASNDPQASTNRSSNSLSLGTILTALQQASRGQRIAPGLPRLQLRLQHSDDDSESEGAVTSNASGTAENRDAEAGPSQAVGGENAGSSRNAGVAGVPVAGRQDSTNVAASAERHRISNATVIDLQATARWVESSLSFFGLLLVVFLYYHIVGLLIFSWLTFVLVKANEQLRRQVALKQRSAIRKLAGVALAVGLHVPAVLWLLRSAKLWNVFIILPPTSVESVWDAFFYVAVVDVLIRYCGMVLKVALLLVLSMSSAEQIRKRGQILTFVEHALLLYRAATPLNVWYMYYVSLKLPPAFFASCTGAYGMFKLSMLYERLVAVFAALKLIMHPEGQYGQYASEQEVAEAGNQCAICQEPMLKPIKLQCTHLFCEACIAEWFERERTCPMCRAVAKPAGLASFKDGGTSLLPQLF